MIRHKTLLFWFLLLLTACETEIDWSPQAELKGGVVVEAVLTDEYKHQEIHLSKPDNYLNANTLPISNAVITLHAAGHQVDFLPAPQQPGTYISEVPFAAVVNVDFHLDILLDGKTYSARARMIPVRPQPPVRYARTAYPDSIKLVPPAFFSLEEQAMHEYIIDWSHLNPEGKTSAKVIFYTFNSIDVSQITPPDKKEVFFPEGSIITYRKYSLTNDFANYLRALVAESRWQGGVFSETSDNLPTNISNGGLGFFAVSAVKTRVDTASVE